VKGSARRLDVVPQALRVITGPVAVAERDRPRTSSDPAKHRVFGIHAVGQEKREVGCEVVDLHPIGKV